MTPFPEMNKSTRIFVAGHNGMVGKALVRSLKNHGYYNILVENKDSLNLLDSSAVESWFRRNNPEIVILAAARVGGIMANRDHPYEFLDENLRIQSNTIKASFINNVSTFVFLGSSCIYPARCHQPMKEDDLMSGKLELTNEGYALAKISGLKLCQYLRRQYEFNAISLMPPNLYGPGDNFDLQTSHVVPGMIRKFHQAHSQRSSYVECWGTGQVRREFMYVDDLANAIIFCIKNQNSHTLRKIIDDYGFINTGVGNDVTISELAKYIASLLGYEGFIRWDDSKPDGIQQKLLDSSNFLNLGFKPTTSLHDGLLMTYDYYRSTL